MDAVATSSSPPRARSSASPSHSSPAGSAGAAGARAASAQEIALASALLLAPPTSQRASVDAAAAPKPADGSFRETDEVRIRLAQ
jgi:hypothetical protein